MNDNENNKGLKETLETIRSTNYPKISLKLVERIIDIQSTNLDNETEAYTLIEAEILEYFSSLKNIKE